MTAADRPPVTDNARAEAERRYGAPDFATPNDRTVKYAAFIEGAEWAAGRAETTTATTEDAERLLAEQYAEWLHRMHRITASTCNHYPEARGTAQALAAAGLLARPTPTRDDISDAIEHSGIAISTSDAEQAANAVLALMEGGTDE